MKLREHRQSDMLTQLCPTPYIEGAQAPMFERFLGEIQPDPEMRLFLQHFAGYCLTGLVAEQLLVVFWGGGANGKSTLVETMLHVLGPDYAMKAKRDLLMAKRGTEHPTSIARLRAKRLVVCVESAEDGRLDETLVKELTGGDTIAARRMREDEWEFSPTHKVVLVTNHRPEVRGTDEAIWRRIVLVPFNACFRDSADPLLKEKLKHEAPGILQWMFAGLRELKAADWRLPRPQQIVEATAEYREEQNPVARFVQERYTRSDTGRIRKKLITEAYQAWAATNRIRHQFTPRWFGSQMAAAAGVRSDANFYYLEELKS